MEGLAEYLEVAALAVVQGLGEFLPISSSGHVLVLAHLFDALAHPLHEKLTINVMLHLGTLLAVIVYYRRRIAALLSSESRTLFLLIVATIPAACAGVGYELWLKDWLLVHLGYDPLDHVLTAGLMFFVTGGVLLSVRRKQGIREAGQLTVAQAVLVGLAQALAILPGLSRSGMTIAAGLVCGLKREEAASFSFLLSIPTIAGATIIEGRKLLHPASIDASLGPIMLGVVLSFAIGLLALAWVIQWLAKGRLSWFAGWVFFMGTVVLIWQIALRA
ncbi:MAG: undecaprenyl-diphosphate phosphatase [Thermogutta sp.]|jgi:undecaprenyl-diphosphatase